VDEITVWRPLVEAFLWPLLFFATCDDETLDPDTAVQQIETIAASLDGLSGNQKKTVFRVLAQIASETADARMKEAILKTPEHLGWSEEGA